MKNPNGRKLGKYRIYSLLGRGATGEVYRAKDSEARRPVAIKVLRAEPFGKDDLETAIQHLTNEVRIASCLHHPNIVALRDSRLQYSPTTAGDDVLGYIVMELVPGRSLARHFQIKDQVGPDFAVQIMAGVLSALEYAHDQGVVHNDIKPGNILLSVAGKVKLGDFGIAHVEAMKTNENGIPFGTLSYIAPERLRELPGDQRSDIFAAGAVFYEALTGKRAFSGHATTIVRRILNEHPVAPSIRGRCVPPAFDEVVARALAKAPEERFASAAEFADAIRAVIGDRRWSEALATANDTSGVTAPLWNINRGEPDAPDEEEEALELSTAPLRRILEQTEAEPEAPAPETPLPKAPIAKPLPVQEPPPPTGIRARHAMMMIATVAIVALLGVAGLWSPSRNATTLQFDPPPLPQIITAPLPHQPPPLVTPPVVAPPLTEPTPPPPVTIKDAPPPVVAATPGAREPVAPGPIPEPPALEPPHPEPSSPPIVAEIKESRPTPPRKPQVAVTAPAPLAPPAKPEPPKAAPLKPVTETALAPPQPVKPKPPRVEPSKPPEPVTTPAPVAPPAKPEPVKSAIAPAPEPISQQPPKPEPPKATPLKPVTETALAPPQPVKPEPPRAEPPKPPEPVTTPAPVAPPAKPEPMKSAMAPAPEPVSQQPPKPEPPKAAPLKPVTETALAPPQPVKPEPPRAEPPKPPAAVIENHAPAVPTGLRHDREYTAALALFRQSNLGAAAQAFQTFITTWPDDPASADALYHLGEIRMALGDARQAQTHFQLLAERYPMAPQATLGLVMLGVAENRLGEHQAACATFNQLRAASLPPWAAQRLAAERQVAECP